MSSNIAGKNEDSKAFVRPQGPPKVWKTIDGFKKVNNEKKPVKLVIQEIPEDRYEDVIDLLCAKFITDEPICKSLNAVNDPAFLKDAHNIWKDLLSQGVSIAAMAENPNGGKPEIAGVNILHVKTKTDHEINMIEQIESTGFKLIVYVTTKMEEDAKVFDFFNIDKYLYAFGLSVHPSYRGQYLGLELLNTRADVCREYNLSVTLTFFSSPVSQREAERANFQVLIEQDYDQMLDEAGNIAFPNVTVKTAKLMARKYD